ncbi:MAG: OadG family protein [Eubacterium sp.]|nr:OadG family protein [Eubacterium sp.]
MLKKKIIPLITLLLMFIFTGCDEEAHNYEFNKDMMIEMTKSIVTNLNGVTELQGDYLLEQGQDYEKGAVNGFRQAQNTDKVGKFLGFDTSEDKVKFEDGNRNNILCTIVCKFENRDVQVKVSYTENKLFGIQKESITDELTYNATLAGYTDVDAYVKEKLGDYGFSTESLSKFVDEYLYANAQISPYTPDECEVTAIYSTGELLANGAKNMGVGMGIVFLVLIFISFIISLLKFVPRLLGREKKPVLPKAPEAPKAAVQETKKESTPQAAIAVPEVGKEVEDGELIAVITAALHAYLSESAGNTGVAHPPAYTASNDGLVVRSIRRVR